MGIFDNFPYTNFHELNLEWILNNMKTLLTTMENLQKWTVEHENEYLELKKLYDDLINGVFPEKLEMSLKEWTVKNTYSIIGDAIKIVLFGLTEDGHFVAYIPENWNEIIFGTTGLDNFPIGYDFGHLTLTY